MCDLVNTSKVKVRSTRTFFKILPMSAFICMETKMYNIFKTKKATKLAKLILKRSYNILLETVLFVALRRLVLFLLAVEFLATFSLQIDITLVII